jgi:hypothetical protein
LQSRKIHLPLWRNSIKLTDGYRLRDDPQEPHHADPG